MLVYVRAAYNYIFFFTNITNYTVHKGMHLAVDKTASVVIAIL